MSSRRIVRWPNSVLRLPANRVHEMTDMVRSLLDDMVTTMDDKRCVGLAAPQIGVSLRLCVVDASIERGNAIRMANPEIVEASEEMNVYTEASPCLPGVSAEVERPAKVVVSYMNTDGEEVVQGFEGVWATSVQHQIDHLDGKMYFERLSRLKRDMLLKRARKPVK